MNKEELCREIKSGAFSMQVADCERNIRIQFEKLQQENQELEKENKILRENAENNDKVVDKVNWENEELKKQVEEYKRIGFKHLNDKCNKLENQQKEFIEYLENEKNIYHYDISDYVYEDIINTILSKYEEIIDK